MTKRFEFSIVMLIRNSELFLNNAIDSVINQNIGFEDNIQLILVINKSIDESLNIALEYQENHPNNIIVLENENSDYASSRNLALDYISGNYVNFFEANDYFSKDLLKSVHEGFKEYGDKTDIITVPVSVFSDKACDPPKVNMKRLVDLNEDYDLSNIYLHSSFIKSVVLDNFTFPTDILFVEDKFLVNNILISKNKIGYINNTKYYFRKRPRKDLTFIDDEYCFNKIDSFFKPLIKKSVDNYGNVPKFLQQLLLQEFSIFVNIEDLNSIFKNEDDIHRFLNGFYEVFDCFELDIIENHDLIRNYIKKFFIYLKNKEFHIETNEQEVFLKTGSYVINNLQYNSFNIDIVELTKDYLNFTGSITSSCYPENISMMAIKKDLSNHETIYEGNYSEYPTTPRKTKTIFNIDWEFSSHFDFSIPVNQEDSFQIEFRLIYKEDDKEVTLSNPINLREYAGISHLSNYFVKHSKIILFKGRTFYCMPYSYKKMLGLEFKSIVRILRDHSPHFLYAVFYRILYIISYVFLKNRRIWLFVDRDFVADDNAEFLYNYCVKQDDGIKKYFIIDKDSQDFKRLNKSNKNIVPFGSFKHKMLYLFSEKIMSSQLTRRIINPFTFKNTFLYEGVSTYDFCFLQHGVILHDLSSWIRKYNKNLYLFVTSADAERDSIVNGSYHYDDDRVQALGLSRYDNLENDSKNEILFIPTWRRNLNTKEAIINSDYLLSLNSFLNNEKLINYAKDHGYSLTFRPHPDLWKFIDLFNINKNFRIADESYQQLFKTSSVMITDYSSVAFDFAYLKKPLIYYHREAFDEFHYNKGYFDYEEMGFGDVVRTEDDLVDKIIGYIDNDCEMEEEYKSRVTKFFKYNDKNNCKRIYDWLISH